MPPLSGQARQASASAISAEAHARALRLCREWDTDKDGSISKKELSRALREIFPDCSAEDIESVMQAVDVNRDGLMQYHEVLEWLRLPSHEKRCFEDSIRSYIRGTSNVTAPVPPLADDFGMAAYGQKLWDERMLQSFVHPLLGRFHVRSEPVDSVTAPADAVLVRVHSRGVRASAGEAACTVALRRDHSGRQLIDASVRTADFGGNGVQRLMAMLRHYAEVQLHILEAFCATIVANAKSACLRFEPPPVIGRDLRYTPPLPQALLSATALALARLSPVRQRKLAKAQIDLCLGSSGAAAEYQTVLGAKVETTAMAVGSACRWEESPPQRKGGWTWIRQDNDPEARLCRLQTFLLTQRASWAGGYEVSPGRTVALTQVESMIQGTSTRLAEPGLANSKPDPAPSRPTALCSPADFGLHERATAMEVSSALASRGRKVAAVNAASAYSVGGGCGSGGRHALEEAWCTTSTLYRSLAAAKAADLAGPDGTSALFPPSHVPTLGCVVSPAVEIFREGSDRGYSLLPAPVCLCGIISVAMFNRNPAVADSPLDSPEDPAVYVAQTQAKLDSVVLAAADLGADVLIVPDVGCGVFQNDPLVIGGCLGAVLRRRSGRIREVALLCGVHAGFSEACRRTFRGEDPRDACPAGSSCSKLSDPRHEARLLHGGARAAVETALVALAAYPEEVKKPVCRYGALCHIKKPEHLARFAHPPPCDTIPWSEVDYEADFNPTPMEFKLPPDPSPGPAKPAKAEPPAAAPRGAPAAAAAAAAGPPAAAAAPPAAAAVQSPPLVAAAKEVLRPAVRELSATSPSSSPSSRPVCKYGEACYNKNPKHLQDFAHPWKDGETPQQAKEREDTTQVHDLLTLAKAGNWTEAKAFLRKRPDLVNGRPDCRSFGLVHHAAWQIRMDEMEALVDDFGADLAARTKEGKSAEDVLNESVQLGGLSTAESARAVALQHWLRRRSEWRSESSPTSVPPAGGGAGPAVSPAVVGALAGAYMGAAAPASPSREPELKKGGAVLTVCSCLNMNLEGDYSELAKGHNGYPVFRKASSGRDFATDHYIYYNFRTSLGWVIDTDLLDSNEPAAYLGASQCGGDPSAKAYGEAWKVHCVNKIAGGYYSRDIVMRIKKR